jgi:ABC-type dipeptide/oligopeptide/nickel transport system ATPase component
MYAGQVVSGPVREVLAAAPPMACAFDLLSDALGWCRSTAARRPARRSDRCRFAPRCPFVLASCRSEPARIEGDGELRHLSACRRDGEADALRHAALDPATWQRSSSFAAS